MDNIIDWNVPNWITIVLMASVGIAIFAAIQSIWIKVRDGKQATA